MLNTKRYENLKNSLVEEGFVVTELIDGNKNPYFVLNSEDGNLYFTVTQEIDYLELYVEAYDEERDVYYPIDEKKYTQPKAAFNFLYEMLTY